jgi:hypothetical protein
MIAVPMISALTSAFPLRVLAAGIAALIRPAWFTWFSGPLITIGLEEAATDPTTDIR